MLVYSYVTILLYHYITIVRCYYITVFLSPNAGGFSERLAELIWIAQGFGRPCMLS